MTTVPVTTQDRIPIPMNVPARPAVHAAGGMTPADVIRVIKQRIYLIVFCFGLFLGLSIAAYFLCNKGVRIPGTSIWLEQKYKSFGVVSVSSPDPSKPLEFGGDRIAPLELMNRWVADQMFLFKQETALAELLKDSDVMATQWYKRELDPTKLVEVLKDDLEVHQAPDATAFVVSFGASQPADAKVVVERSIQLYLNRMGMETKANYMSQLEGAYRTQLSDLQKERDNAEQRKRALAGSQGGVTGLAEGRNIDNEKLRGLLLESARAETEFALIRSQWETLRTVDPSQLEPTPEVLAVLESDPQIAQLNRDILISQQDYDELLRRVGPKHKVAQAKAAELASFQARLQDLRDQKQRQGLALQKNQAERAYKNASDVVIWLREQILAEQGKARDADTKLLQYQLLVDEQKNLDDQIAQLKDYITQLRLMIENDSQRVRVEWAARPFEAKLPSSPKLIIFLPVGGVLGIMVGLGLAFLLEITDTRVKTGRDLARHGHIPVLGTVPDLDDEEIPIETIELAAHTAPRSMVAEAFRIIRTNLMLSSPAERQRSLLVTSARPEEGKTTVAVNLAISIAQNNRRVLLVDSNFHRPVLRNFFSGISTEGLSNILIGQSTLSDVVVKTSLPNLDVIGSGPIPPNPSELLASAYMRQFLGQAVDTYDQVVFDGPPALLVSDVMVLAGVLDGIILVCRADSTSRGVLLRAREQLERAGIRIFGGVLNAASVYKRGGYFREQIRDYYEYQPPAEALAGSPPKALPPGQQQSSQRL